MTNNTNTPQPAFSQKTGPDARRARLMKDGKLGWRCRVYNARLGLQLESTFYGTEQQAAQHTHDGQACNTSSEPTSPEAQDFTVGLWSQKFLTSYYWTQRPTDDTPGLRRNPAVYGKARAVVSGYIVPSLGESTRISSITPDRLHAVVTGLRGTSRHHQEIVAHLLRLMVAAAAAESCP
jgi:hypothetical protein